MIMMMTLMIIMMKIMIIMMMIMTVMTNPSPHMSDTISCSVVVPNNDDVYLRYTT
jgi:hypothetical protein